MSDLNLVVPSSSQRPKVSIKPGWGARLGSSGGGGNRLGTARLGSRPGAWLGAWPGAWLGGAVGACVSCATTGPSSSSAQAPAHAIRATPRTPIVPERLVITRPVAIAAAGRLRTGHGEIEERWNNRNRNRSEQIERRDDACDQHDREDRHPEAQSLLEDGARLIAIAVEHERHRIEAHAARDDRQQHEQQEIVAGEPGRNGNDLVRDRSQSLEQDDPAAPLRISGT